MKPKLLQSGLCECVYEPRGDHGLEGYQLRDSYRFAKMTPDKNGKDYYRVFPDDHVTPEYYETCSQRVFDKHFKIIS